MTVKKKSRKKTARVTKAKMKEKEPARSKLAVLSGYDISMRTHERRAALTTDANQWGTLKTLKQLNGIREAQQWNPRAHEVLTRDLEYLQKVYQKTAPR